MLKKITILVLSVIMMITFTSCEGGIKKSGGVIIGEGEIKTEKYDLKGFKSLNIAKDFQVNVKKGEKFKVEISTNSDIFQHLNVYVDGDGIYAQYKKGTVISETIIKMNITMPMIQNIMVENDGILSLDGAFKWDGDSTISLENDAKLMGTFSTGKLRLKMANDSIINLVGSANEIVADGVSDTQMQLSMFEVKTGSVKLKSDASCKLLVKEKVELTALGESIFTMFGDGEISEIEVDEDAKVIKAK